MSVATSVVSVEEFTAFRERVLEVKRQLEVYGRGVQQRVAYETHMGPSRISGMLNCRFYDLDALERVESWLKLQQPKEGPSPQQKRIEIERGRF